MEENEIENRFQQLAMTNGLSFRKDSAGSYRVTGNGFVVRIVCEVERQKGIFVTLSKEPPSNLDYLNGYGIGYLIEFKDRDASSNNDAVLSNSDDPETMARLVEQYCLSYLKGEASDFSEFERFAIQPDQR